MKNKYQLLLIAILIIGLALRVRLSMDNCLHQWDERFHALVSKNMMKQPLKPTLYEIPVLKYDYKAWYSNHVWIHKQPLPLWLMAGSYGVFGVNEFTTRLPSLIFSLLAIFITFLIGKSIFSEKVGVLSAFFMAINGLVLEIGSGRIATDHYDLLFMAFIEISILFAYYNSRDKNPLFAIASGIFMGFAVLTKWLPCLIVLPIHYFFLKEWKTKPNVIIKQLAVSFITCIVIAAPWQVYILYNFPLEAKWEYFHHWLHMTKELDGRTGNGYLYFLNKIMVNYSEIIFIPLIFYGYQLIKSKFKNFKLLALFVWVIIPIVFFSLAKTKMQGYILFVCPALFILTSNFFCELKDNIIKTSLNKGLLIFYQILLVAIIILPVRYCFERTKFGFEEPVCENYIEGYKKLKGHLPKNSIVLNVKHPVEFMFYNDCLAYNQTELNEEERVSLIKSGYKVLMYDEVNNAVRVMILKKQSDKTNSK